VVLATFTVAFAVGYPVGVGLVHRVLGAKAPFVDARTHVLAVAVLLAAMGLATAWFLVQAQRDRPWDAMAFALSPLLPLVALAGWDFLALTCAAAALWAWRRGWALPAGVLAGAGAFVAVWPALLVVAFVAVAVRLRRGTDGGLAFVGAGATWVLLQVVVALAHWSSADLGLGSRLQILATRRAGQGTLWYVVAQWGHPLRGQTASIFAWLLFLLAAVAVVVLVLLAPRPPRVAQVALLLVAALLVLDKVHHPAYALWLLPLAALARPRWRDLLVWQSLELAYVGMLVLFGEQTKDGFSLLQSSINGTPAYTWAIVLRVAGELWLVAVVVRDVLLPEHDPVADERTEAAAGPRVSARAG
jgi:uncharacterized membrane protein